MEVEKVQEVQALAEQEKVTVKVEGLAQAEEDQLGVFEDSGNDNVGREGVEQPPESLVPASAPLELL